MQDFAGNGTVGVQEDRNKRFAMMPGTDIFGKLVASAGRPAGNGIWSFTGNFAATLLSGKKRRRQPMNIV